MAGVEFFSHACECSSGLFFPASGVMRLPGDGSALWHRVYSQRAHADADAEGPSQALHHSHRQLLWPKGMCVHLVFVLLLNRCLKMILKAQSSRRPCSCYNLFLMCRAVVITLLFSANEWAGGEIKLLWNTCASLCSCHVLSENTTHQTSSLWIITVCFIFILLCHWKIYIFMRKCINFSSQVRVVLLAAAAVDQLFVHSGGEGERDRQLLDDLGLSGVKCALAATQQDKLIVLRTFENKTTNISHVSFSAGGGRAPDFVHSRGGDLCLPADSLQNYGDANGKILERRRPQ